MAYKNNSAFCASCFLLSCCNFPCGFNDTVKFQVINGVYELLLVDYWLITTFSFSNQGQKYVWSNKQKWYYFWFYVHFNESYSSLIQCARRCQFSHSRIECDLIKHNIIIYPLNIFIWVMDNQKAFPSRRSWRNIEEETHVFPFYWNQMLTSNQRATTFAIISHWEQLQKNGQTPALAAYKGNLTVCHRRLKWSRYRKSISLRYTSFVFSNSTLFRQKSIPFPQLKQLWTVCSLYEVFNNIFNNIFFFFGGLQYFVMGGDKLSLRECVSTSDDFEIHELWQLKYYDCEVGRLLLTSEPSIC